VKSVVKSVGDQTTFHCSTPNLKTLWYRTTNSSTYNCRQPLIQTNKLDIVLVLCEPLAQGSVVRESLRHRFSLQATNRLQTLVISHVETSDSGKYAIIDSVDKRLICLWDLVVLGWFRRPQDSLCCILYCCCLHPSVVCWSYCSIDYLTFRDDSKI